MTIVPKQSTDVQVRRLRGEDRIIAESGPLRGCIDGDHRGYRRGRRLTHRAAVAIAFAASTATPTTAQEAQEAEDRCGGPRPEEAVGAHTGVPSLSAGVAIEPIQIDGQLAEAAWRDAAVAGDFTQNDPIEGAPASERTDVRVIYEPDALVIGAMLHDSHPVSSRLGRRDDRMSDSDWFIVSLDSYHDHRTAFRFRVNPGGVRGDAVVSGGGGGGGPGGGGDSSWDPVWQAETMVTDSGWTAEMRIPFSQLRFSESVDQTWGIQFTREISRNNEDSDFAFTPTSERGGIARYGHLIGLADLEQGRPFEVLPYILSRAEYTQVDQSGDVAFADPFRDGSNFFAGVGADVKYRLTSNLTLDATLNPDFGQVEVDPAVVNLSAFETRFDEKRPFFIEGADIFSFGSGGGGGGPGGGPTQLFYSRRIGGRPHGEAPDDAVYVNEPEATTILGATKLTGRTASGWSLGVLEAVTAREHVEYIDDTGTESETIVEPITNYLVGRAERQFRQGQTVIGAIATAVNRRLDGTPLIDDLRSAAYSAGIDFTHEWSDRAWSLNGYFAASHIAGEPAVIEDAQRSSARYYQRPDADYLSIDATATSLRGYAAQLELEKQAGEHWRGDAGVSLTSPGYEVNDLGFQSRADRVRADAEIRYVENEPGRVLRFWDFDVRPELTWNFGGDLLERGIRFGGFGELLNYWGGRINYSHDFSGLNARLTRGGPLASRPATDRFSFDIFSDRRKPWTISFEASIDSDAAGGSEREIGVELGLKPASNWSIRLEPNYSKEHVAAQYLDTIEDPTATGMFGNRYLFAELDQTTVSMDVRLDVAFSPDLTLELYAQPFLASGAYGRPRQLRAPRTFEFDGFGEDGSGRIDDEPDGYRIDPDGGGPAAEFFVEREDFNIRSLRGNAVLRWQWRPGSTIFFVWQQERSDELEVGDFDFGRDSRALFRSEPENVFVVKMNYWFSP